jgi:hypothetical protein
MPSSYVDAEGRRSMGASGAIDASANPVAIRIRALGGKTDTIPFPPAIPITSRLFGPVRRFEGAAAEGCRIGGKHGRCRNKDYGSCERQDYTYLSVLPMGKEVLPPGFLMTRIGPVASSTRTPGALTACRAPVDMLPESSGEMDSTSKHFPS